MEPEMQRVKDPLRISTSTRACARCARRWNAAGQRSAEDFNYTPRRPRLPSACVLTSPAVWTCLPLPLALPLFPRALLARRRGAAAQGLLSRTSPRRDR